MVEAKTAEEAVRNAEEVFSSDRNVVSFDVDYAELY